MELKKMKCVPCEGNVKPLKGQSLTDYKNNLEPGWSVIDEMKIHKEYPSRNFMQGVVFLNKIANVAEEEGHHPDVCVSYTKVTVELYTHAIGGLSENDFIMAAKIDDLLKY